MLGYRRPVGTLEDVASDRRLTLGGRVLVGRSDHCALCIEHGSVSGEHAMIRFRGDRWFLRDLGSRNGTQIDERPIEAGREIPIEQGSVFTFGSRSVRWRLAEAAPPNLRATHAESGATLEASDGLLMLPDEETPECTIFTDDDAWILERGDERRAPADQEQLSLPSGAWRLLVPSDNPLESTAISGSEPNRLQHAKLTFRVSRDGEHVELDAEGIGWKRALGARAHNDVLLALAEARLDDQQDRPELPEPDRGWVYVDDLCRMAGVTPSALDLHVFRARKHLAQSGIHNAGRIVERRPQTKQLRLGVGDVTVADADGIPLIRG